MDPGSHFYNQNWLERTPGVDDEDFCFIQKFQEGVERMLQIREDEVKVLHEMKQQLMRLGFDWDLERKCPQRYRVPTGENTWKITAN